MAQEIGTQIRLLHFERASQMNDEKRTKEPRLEPCDCIPCPDCGGAGWYAQQVSDTEQEQRQCGTCDYKGRVRTPPESWNPKEREELVNIIKQPLVFEFVFNKNDYPVSLKFTPEKLADAILASGFTKSNRVPLDVTEVTNIIISAIEDGIISGTAKEIAEVICQKIGTTKNMDKGEK